MKTIIFISAAFISFRLMAQVGSFDRPIYPVTIYLNSGHAPEGEILETGDTAVTLMLKKAETVHPDAHMYVPVSEINTIDISTKHSTGKGVWMGALIGFGTGALIGLASGDDQASDSFIRFTAGEKALMFGAILSFPGMIIGAIAGTTTHLVIPIRGKQENYAQHRSKLVEYSILKK